MKDMKKMIAAVMVLAVALAGAIVVFGGNESDATTTADSVDGLGTTAVLLTDGMVINDNTNKYYYTNGNVSNVKIDASTTKIVLKSGTTVGILSTSGATATIYVASEMTDGVPTKYNANGSVTTVNGYAISVKGSFTSEKSVYDVTVSSISAVGTITTTDADVSILVTEAPTVASTMTFGKANAVVTYEDKISIDATGSVAITLSGPVIFGDSVEISNNDVSNTVTVTTSATNNVTGTIKTANSTITGKNLVIGTYSAAATVTASYPTMGSNISYSGVMFDNDDAITTVGDLDVTGLDFKPGTSITASAGSVTGIVSYADGTTLVLEKFKGVFTKSNYVLTTLTSGNINLISGSFKTNGSSPVVSEGCTLYVGTGAELELQDNLTVNGTMNLAGCAKAGTSKNIDVVDSTGAVATFNALSGAVLQKVKVISSNSTGTINLTGGMKNHEIGEDINFDVEYSQLTNVIIIDDISIVGLSTVKILGKLTIENDVPVYIQKGSTLQVGEGTIVADVDIMGVLDVDGTFTVNSKKINVSQGGEITINETGALIVQSGDLTIGSGSKLIINNKINMKAGTSLNVKGEMIIDGMVIDATSSGLANVVINMVASDAVVQVVSLTITSSQSLSVTDLSLVKVGSSTVFDSADESKVQISTTSSSSEIKGLMISESVSSSVKSGSTVYSKTLNVSGSVSHEAASGYATITVTGGNDANVVVKDDLSIGEKMALAVEKNLTVTGQMNFVADSTASTDITGEGVITVTGIIVSGESITVGAGGIATLNAVYYSVVENAVSTHYYTTLEKAVASEQTKITVYGSVEVKSDVSVPSTMTVNNDSAVINVDDGVVLTLVPGSKLKAGTVNVEGEFIVENKRSVSGTTVISDVSNTEGDKIIYTNVYRALENASEGAVVVITKEPGKVVLDKDIVIKTGVTLQIDAAKNVEVKNKVTVTVDGTLYVNNGSFSPVTKFGEKASDSSSKLIVNGVYKTLNPVTYGVDFVVPGAYYEVTDSTGQYYYIAPVESAVQIINDTQNDTVNVYGKNIVGDISIVGTTSSSAKMYIYGTLIAGTVSIDDAIVTVNSGSFSGIITGASGTIELSNIDDVVISEYTSNDVAIVSISGTPTVADTSATAADPAFDIVSGVVTVVKGTTFDATEQGIVIGIEDGSTLKVLGTFEDDSLVVEGTLDVAVATSTTSAGNASVTYLAVGSDDYTTGGVAASVLGIVSNVELAVVFNGASIEQEFDANVYRSTVFVIDGVEWAHVYTIYNNIAINNIQPEFIPGAKFSKWTYVDDDGKKQDVVNSDYIGSIDKVTASLTTKVYNVKILIDSGFSDVYIDGEIVSSTGMYVDGLTVSLAVGEHTVTYKLKGDYGGTIQMTFNGDAINGKFNITSDMSYNNTYKLVLTGAMPVEPVTPTPAPVEPTKDDSMGITEYLLIVLVVLAAILVVVVAIRMMRS